MEKSCTYQTLLVQMHIACFEGGLYPGRQDPIPLEKALSSFKLTQLLPSPKKVDFTIQDE